MNLSRIHFGTHLIVAILSCAIAYLLGVSSQSVSKNKLMKSEKIPEQLAKIKKDMSAARSQIALSSDPQVQLRSEYSRFIVAFLGYEKCSKEETRMIIESFSPAEYEGFVQHISFVYSFNLDYPQRR
jgi:hypothetical protein